MSVESGLILGPGVAQRQSAGLMKGTLSQVRFPAGAAGEVSSPGPTQVLCGFLFRYPFQPRVTAVARTPSWPFLWQKCR